MIRMKIFIHLKLLSFIIKAELYIVFYLKLWVNGLLVLAVPFIAKKILY